MDPICRTEGIRSDKWGHFYTNRTIKRLETGKIPLIRTQLRSVPATKSTTVSNVKYKISFQTYRTQRS